MKLEKLSHVGLAHEEDMAELKLEIILENKTAHYGRRLILFRNLWAEVCVVHLKLVNAGSRDFMGLF